MRLQLLLPTLLLLHLLLCSCSAALLLLLCCRRCYFCRYLQSVEPILCPAGTFGATAGLKSSNCSGLCLPGHYCPAGATSGTQIACPAGIYGSEAGLTTGKAWLVERLTEASPRWN